MSTHTPEQQQMERILESVLDAGHIEHDADEHAWSVEPRAIRALAAPLEAANARIAELEAERDKLRKLAQLVRDAVEAGAIDEIYLSMIRDALGEVSK